MVIRYTEYPVIQKGPNNVLDVIHEAAREGRGGLDLEYGISGPTIIGVASKHRCAAAYWEPILGEVAINAGIPWSAHAGITADKPVIEKALSLQTPLSLWRDTMLMHWICNPDLSSAPKAMVGEDADDPGSVLGFMNLWSMTSMLHDISNWKQCYSALTSWDGHPIQPEAAARCASEGRVCGFHTPLEYCAVDSWAGLVSDYSLEERMTELQIPWSYYEFKARLTEYCHKMTLKGVLVDTEVIKILEETIQSTQFALFPFTLSNVSEKTGKTLKKTCRVWEGPFNPNSPKAALAWFLANGIELQDHGKPSKSKHVILKALEKRLKSYGLEFDPKSNSLLGDYSGELPEPLDMLLRVVQKSYAGKNLSSWFDNKYITNDESHPRFIVTGTSTGRLASSKPNYQNIPRVGFGAQVRQAITAPTGYQVIKADFSQLEFRICLWASGLNPDEADGAFDRLAEKANGRFDEPAKRLSWKIRDVAKSLIHGSDYLESLAIKTSAELSTPVTQGDRKAGALLVYDGRDLPEWKFRGGYVCFTGANIAERLLGNRSRENRAKALELQNIYLTEYPQIREFQQNVSEQIERTCEVRLPGGHRVELYGRKPEDDLKYAAALWGQGGGALYVDEGMLRFADLNEIMRIQCHDEYLFYVPLNWSDKQCLEFMQPMVQPSVILKHPNKRGFTCPAKVSRGPNWKETREIGVIRYTD